jgi:hypothetical protein
LIKSVGALALAKHLDAQCGVMTPMGQACTASLNFQQLAVSITTQQCAEWCWAASIAMILTFNGHPIDQKEIVIQTYGARYGTLPCLPAGTDATLASALSSQYVDLNGTNFTSQITAAFDAQSGYVGINNATIVNELLANRPLLVCNTHHAMVIYGVVYIPNPMGPPAILRVDVVDPWPYSPRLHPLSPPEIIPVGMMAAPGVPGQLMFVASVATS